MNYWQLTPATLKPFLLTLIRSKDFVVVVVQNAECAWLLQLYVAQFSYADDQPNSVCCRLITSHTSNQQQFCRLLHKMDSVSLYLCIFHKKFQQKVKGSQSCVTNHDNHDCGVDIPRAALQMCVRSVLVPD